MSFGHNGDDDLHEALRFALLVVDRHANLVVGLADTSAKKGMHRSEAQFREHASMIRKHAEIIRTCMPWLEGTTLN
ncbi:MAG: hypothetical protein JWO51_2486 [Rhodospirillales bacterium]|nr:hypothetical protein [Rhodospirillales bacterium]